MRGGGKERERELYSERRGNNDFAGVSVATLASARYVTRETAACKPAFDPSPVSLRDEVRASGQPGHVCTSAGNAPPHLSSHSFALTMPPSYSIANCKFIITAQGLAVIYKANGECARNETWGYHSLAHIHHALTNQLCLWRDVKEAASQTGNTPHLLDGKREKNPGCDSHPVKAAGNEHIEQPFLVMAIIF